MIEISYKTLVVLDTMLIFSIVCLLIGLVGEFQNIQTIKQLKQINVEQMEEKEYYIRRCEMLEDLLEENGLVIDNYECF